MAPGGGGGRDDELSRSDNTAAGVRIRLIADGDVGGAIPTTDPSTGIDVLLGVVGAPEGVLGRRFCAAWGEISRGS